MEKLKIMKVAVLMGGMSSESEVSLKSGAAALAALGRLGIEAVGIDAGRDVVERMRACGAGLAFIALHGRYGEDGCVQGAPLRAGEDVARLTLGAPCVVKPANGGSSIGVTICMTQDEIAPAVRKAFEYDGEVIVERFIEGSLITVGIIGARVLPPIEIETTGGFYDFAHKYTAGRTRYHCPARLDAKIAAQAQAMTMAMSRALGCRGMSRSELIVDRAGKPWFIELNTIPGMTELSLLPMGARQAGMSFDEMTLAILREAVGDADA
ncbi:MAG: ATP-grasp domain-containing protein [Nitrospinae bacterium]|nr:ATP-grasp domain-containing protein [Nitrospinota bacterium]